MEDVFYKMLQWSIPAFSPACQHSLQATCLVDQHFPFDVPGGKLNIMFLHKLQAGLAHTPREIVFFF